MKDEPDEREAYRYQMDAGKRRQAHVVGKQPWVRGSKRTRAHRRAAPRCLTQWWAIRRSLTVVFFSLGNLPNAAGNTHGRERRYCPAVCSQFSPFTCWRESLYSHKPRVERTHIYSSNVVLVGFLQLLHDLHLGFTTSLQAALHRDGPLRVANS